MEEHSSRFRFLARHGDAIGPLLVGTRRFVLLLAGLFAACSLSTPYVRTYQGAPLPWKEVAILLGSLKNDVGTRVYSIDGEQVRDNMGFFELLPGKHEVEAGFSGEVRAYFHVSSRGTLKMGMDAKAGRVYRLAVEPQMVSATLLYRIEDVTEAIWTDDSALWNHTRGALLQSFTASRRESTPADVIEAEFAAREKQMRQVVKERIALNQPYLEGAASKPGAQKLPSGGIYLTRTAGNGPNPRMSNTVKVQYEVYLVKAPSTERSQIHSQTQELSVMLAHECLQNALLQMKVGGKAEMVCPPKYGGPILLFEIELLEITK